MVISRACAEDSSSLAGLASPVEGMEPRMKMVLDDADDHMEGQETSVAQLTEMGVGLSLPTLLVFA